MTPADLAFYQVLGPHLLRRDAMAEVGGPVYVEVGSQWFVVRDGCSVLGWSCLEQVGGRAVLRASWVAPWARRRGIYRALFDARLEAVKRPADVTCHVKPELEPFLARYGFERLSSGLGSRVKVRLRLEG